VRRWRAGGLGSSLAVAAAAPCVVASMSACLYVREPACVRVASRCCCACHCIVCGDGVRGRAASGVFGLEAHDWCESVARRVALLCAEAQHLLRHAEPSRIGRSGHDRRAVG
jgi:hypothetical protein